MRNVVLFGNGLGRAIDNRFFDLSRALQDAWVEPGVLDEAQRDLVRQCLPSGKGGDSLQRPPLSEDELETLQRVQFACNEIKELEKSDFYGWLTDHGRDFPVAIRKYVHAAAYQFHRDAPTLDRPFIEPLIDFLIQTRSHVTTLNYDALLYNAFFRYKSKNGASVFSGYGYLIDGFSGKFSDDKLRRSDEGQQAYYLHLHGSPLFFTDEQGEIRKRSQYDLRNHRGLANNHIVLSHTNYKLALISASSLLSKYWVRLEEAMAETRSIILFGYGGGDTHLNQMISRKYRGSKDQVIVVQRRDPTKIDSMDQIDANQDWQERIPSCRIKVVRETNILNFRQWGAII